MGTPYNGTTGTFTIATHVYVVKGWSADVETEMLDVMNKASDGFHEYIAGPRKISGSIDMFYDGNAVEDGTYGEFTLSLPDDKTLTGNGYLNKISYDSPVDGVVTLKADLTGTGAFEVGGS